MFGTEVTAPLRGEGILLRVSEQAATLNAQVMEFRTNEAARNVLVTGHDALLPRTGSPKAS